MKPVLQVSEQVVPSQAVTPFGSVAHGEQRPPHVETEVLRAQVDPHAWYPLPQLIVHDEPLQPATPFGSVGHGEHALPQVAVALFETQTPLQRWKPGLQT